MCGYWIRGEVFTLDSSIALCRLSSKCMQIYRYLLLLAILFVALLFIKAPVILLPAVIFVSFPLVWFPGITFHQGARHIATSSHICQSFGLVSEHHNHSW